MLYSSVKNHQMNIKDIQVIIIVYDYMCPRGVSFILHPNIVINLF